MHLVDLSKLVSEASSMDDVLAETRGLWSAIYDRMSSEEILWVIAPNEYNEGRMWPVSMAIADFARDESNLKLKNTITLHTWDDRGADMESAYDEILFFVRNKREYQFHKDRIRVEHVYQGHEWGDDRESGSSAYHDTEVQRYNPEGKDPGNVWLNEDRTQTEDQSVDETGPLSLREAVRRCLLAGSNDGETVHLVNASDDIVDMITEENRRAEPLAISQLREEAAD